MVPHSLICANSKSAEFANSPDFPFQGGQSPARSACFSGHPLKAPQGHLLPAVAAYAHRRGRFTFLPIALLPGNHQTIRHRLGRQASGRIARNNFNQSVSFLERNRAIQASPFRIKESRRNRLQRPGCAIRLQE